MIQVKGWALGRPANDPRLHRLWERGERFRHLGSPESRVSDVSIFDRLARVYDLLMPPADATPLINGFGVASGQVETILDIGGGSGRATRALDNNPIVCDAARGMLERAREWDLDVVQTDAGKLPFRDQSVDAVMIVDAFHHFQEPAPTIKEVKRTLRPGGVVVIREFDPRTLRGRVIEWGESRFGFDSAFYSPTQLEERVGSTGLETQILDRGFTYTLVGKRTMHNQQGTEDRSGG